MRESPATAMATVPAAVAPISSFVPQFAPSALGERGAALSIRRAAVAHLGHTVGNRAVARLVGNVRAAVQRQEEPADIAIQDDFNPGSILHQLLIAIDQSDTYVAESKPNSGSNGFAIGYQMVLKRKVNFPAVVKALDGLTPAQAKRVEAEYAAHENNRSLVTDLFGKGESGFDSNLNENQRAHIRALLAGTKAGSHEEQASAAANRATAQAAEVQRLLKGKPSKANVEQVMALLRQSKEANTALNEAYKRLGGLLYVDLERTGQSPRAELLMEGRAVEADALKVSGARRRLEEVNAEIEKLKTLLAPKELSLANLAMGSNDIERMVNEQALSKLRAEQTKLIAEIEATGQQAIKEARDQQGDVGARVAAVFGDVAALKGAVGDKSAPVIQALVDNRPAVRIAAELRRSADAGKLTGPQLTAALRSLRAEADDQAKRLMQGAAPDAIKVEADRIASTYFRELRATYDDLTKDNPKRKPFDDVVAETGNAGDEQLNVDLIAAGGRLSDVRELVLALQGDRKDMATVERVLRDKDALTIKILKSQYMVMTMGRSLDSDLFGLSGTKAGQEDFSSLAMAPGEIRGKASGTARLNLEDYMQRPDKHGGPEEVAYIWARATREYEYTIEHGGITGSINDAFGNEPRKLLDETKTELSLLVLQYRRLVGWDPESNTVLYPQDLHSPEALDLIHRMRLARHTIRGDRAAYEEATAKLRATFEAIASFVLQAALSAVLTPAAAALFRVAKGTHAALTLGNQVRKFAATLAASTGSNIGSTIAVTGDYSVAQLKSALAGGAAGQFGGLAFDKVLGRVAKGLAEQKAWNLSVELRDFAKNTVSTEASLWTEGKSLLEDPSLTRLLTEHFQGRAGELITAGTTQLMPGLDGPPAAGGTESSPPSGGETTTGEGSKSPPTGEAAPVPGADGTTPETTSPPETASTVPDATPPTQEEAGSVGLGGGGGRGPGGDGGGGGSSGRLPPRPLPQMPPSRPVRVPSAITDPRVAAEAFRVQARNGNPVVKAIGNRAVLLREWRDANRNNRQYEPGYIDNPPPAWTDHEGNIVIDKSRVDPSSPDGVPGTPSTAVHGGDGDGAATKPGGPEMGSAASAKSPAGGTAQSGALEGTVWQAGNKDSEAEAFKLYRRQVAADPGREVAMIYNHDVKQWAIVQGGPDSVPLNEVLARLGWDRKSTSAGRHSHPDGVLAGQTAELNHLPSGRGYDLDVVRGDSYKGPATEANQWHAIDIMIDGKPDRTWVVYSRKTGEWTVDFPDKGERGGRGQKSFSTTAEYNAWYKDRFGVEPRHNPTSAGGPGTTAAAEPGAARDVEQLARLNTEVASLAQGEGVPPIPTQEGLAQSQIRIDIAQEILADPAATPESRRMALEAIVQRAIEDFRAKQLAEGEVEPHPEGAAPLSAEGLADYCGTGRDITADSILSLVGTSSRLIVVERVQMSNIMKNNHSLTLVTLPGGARFLVDPTFAQFVDRGRGPYFRGEAMLASSEGAALAASLLEGGMIPLTPANAQQYVLGLGAKPDDAGAIAARLLAGDAAVVTELIRNGEIDRIPGKSADADDLFNVYGVHGDDGSAARLRKLLASLPPDDPRRPQLEALVSRLEALAHIQPELVAP